MIASFHLSNPREPHAIMEANRKSYSTKVRGMFYPLAVRWNVRSLYRFSTAD